MYSANLSKAVNPRKELRDRAYFITLLFTRHFRDQTQFIAVIRAVLYYIIHTPNVLQPKLFTYLMAATTPQALFF